jgi:hypothetical protein
LINLIKNYYLYIFVIFAFLLFTIGYDYALPIEVVPDEVAQLKNIYAMINSKSLSLQYISSYSIWTHYIYMISTLLYWGVFYIFSDLSSINDLKFYIMNNYQDVIAFLRIFTATLFLFSLVLVRNVIKDILNIIQANLFFIFVSLNLLVIINLHYAKHWMVDFALVFFAFYFYWLYKKENKLWLLLFSCFIFSFGVLSSYPLIFMGIYLIFIHYSFSKDIKKLFYDIGIFVVIFLSMSFITYMLGSGIIAGSIMSNPSQYYFADINTAFKLLIVELDYDPFTFVFFILSILLLIYTKNKKILFALIPYIFNYYLMSTLSFQPRYALFMTLDGAFIATFFAVYLYNNYKKISIIIFITYIIYNLFIISMWLNLVLSKDTRLSTRDWILEQNNNKYFYIYNTLGFNYIALTKESVNFIKINFPKAISTREKLHLSKKLIDGKNGVILWKVSQSGYKIENLVQKIINNGYTPILINERFGKSAMFYEKVNTDILFEKFDIKLIKSFSPYKNKSLKINENIGDILLNFTNIVTSLSYLDKSGPVMKIYKIFR